MLKIYKVNGKMKEENKDGNKEENKEENKVSCYVVCSDMGEAKTLFESHVGWKSLNITLLRIVRK